MFYLYLFLHKQYCSEKEYIMYQVFSKTVIALFLLFEFLLHK
jgi:hypothetical protein